MKGQTTIAFCAWCGLPSSTSVEICGPRTVKNARGEPQRLPAVRVPACEDHGHPTLGVAPESVLQRCVKCGERRCDC